VTRLVERNVTNQDLSWKLVISRQSLNVFDALIALQLGDIDPGMAPNQIQSWMVQENGPVTSSVALFLHCIYCISIFP
jgi:hypothetical protein